ncbi:MAG: hypothetical protein J7527_13205 [Chitinophagaceae bacterium]|nr:hypothetical protein [Chitinophagaceae bacterium]
MPTFITTIKLEEGTSTDYQLLSTLLKKSSFTITSEQKKVLKDRTFISHGTISSISQDVLKAARKTGRTFSFMIIRQKTW